MIVKETLEYYRKNKSTVYCTMLDTTKAFDRVEYCKLVRLLLKKNVPHIIISILQHRYLFHFTKVAWNGARCNSFRVLNGVIYDGVYACRDIVFTLRINFHHMNGDNTRLLGYLRHKDVVGALF